MENFYFSKYVSVKWTILKTQDNSNLSVNSVKVLLQILKQYDPNTLIFNSII